MLRGPFVCAAALVIGLSWLGPGLAQTEGATALRALVGTDGPAPLPPVLVDGGLTLPLDWKALPQSREVWRRDDLWPDLGATVADGVLVARGRGGYLGVDVANGATRWTIPIPATGARGSRADRVVAGCDGLVVLVGATRMFGVRVETGEVVWSHRHPRRRGAGAARPGHATSHGCRVSLLRASDGALAQVEPSSLMVLDVRTGSEHRLTDCGPGCEILDPRPDGLLLRDRSRARWVHLDRGGPAPMLPPETRYVTSIAGVRFFPIAEPRTGRLRGLSDSGVERWRTGVLRSVDLRVGDLAIGFTLEPSRRDNALRALDLLRGNGRWALPVRGNFPTRGIFAAGDGTLVYHGGRRPRVLAVFDLDTGRPESLRLGPRLETRELVLAGSTAVLIGDRQTVAVRLDVDAPSIRSRLSLADDVRRAEAMLRGASIERRMRRAPAGYHDHPATPREARLWLNRLAPLLRERRSPRTLRSSDQLTAEPAAPGRSRARTPRSAAPPGGARR